MLSSSGSPHRGYPDPIEEKSINGTTGGSRNFKSLDSRSHFLLPSKRVRGNDNKRDFYRTYGLQALRNRGILMPVHGQGIELDQSIFRAAGKKLKASDLVFISFENEAAALQSRVTQLHLSSEILGTTRDQNGAYPVALLGAQLLKGNPGLPKRVLLQRGRQFRLNVTPAYGDMPILGKLIAAYQSRAVHRSA